MLLGTLQDGREVAVQIKQLFVKVVLPLWLRELRQVLAPTAMAPVGANDEPPRKRPKNRSELNEATAQRRSALRSLKSSLFLPVEVRCTERRGGATARFTWYKTATTASDKAVQAQNWEAQGKSDLFALFHPGSNKPFNIKQCAALSLSGAA